MSGPEWWKSAVVYQIYPRSFMDSDGDGIGDLRGIASRLDHLAWLGVDCIWISPIFKSPMVDMGYDVEDYCDVNPEFGTLADLDALIAAAHAKNIRVLLDLVPNHTSDRHRWFVESRKSKDSPKRDWYLWRDRPNNWMSVFGGSAWEKDEKTGQFYYHAYLKEQPDLNWRNPEVERAMHGVIRFWLERGVDGFRVDVIAHLIKDALFRDDPPNPDWQPGQPDARSVLHERTIDQPEVHAVIARMHRLLAEFRDRVFIGEIYLEPEKLAAYYGTPSEPECDLPFNFSLIYPKFEWSASHLASTIGRYRRALPAHGWPNWVLGNHDVKRIATRVGPAQAKVAAALLLTLEGTPTLYQGDELGIADVVIPPDRVTDTRERTQPGFGRDPVRTPMPWDGSPNAGFSSGQPWLPLNADAASRNVAVMSRDPSSILGWHRALLDLRRRMPALSLGGTEGLSAIGPVLRFDRNHGRDRIGVFLNLSSSSAPVDAAGQVLLSTHERTEASTLAPDEARLVRL